MSPDDQSPPDTMSQLMRHTPRRRMLMAVLAPVLALVGFSAYVVEEKLDTYRRSADLLVAAQVAHLAHGLARDVENERGVAALYVGAGRSSWRPDLDQQRAATDRDLAELRTILSTPAARRLLDQRPAELLNGQLDAARAAVDGDGDLKTVLETYSAAISQLISASGRLANHDLSNLIAAYMDLGNIKDRLARARTLGASWVLDGRRDPRLLAMFTAARAEIRAFSESFRGHASTAQLRIYEDIVTGPILEEVDRLHARAQAGKLTQADSDIWMRTHMALADLISRAEDRLAQDMEGDIEANLGEAKVTFYVIILAVVGLIAFSVETMRRSERRAARAQEEAHKLYRAVDQSPVAVVITDPSGRIEYVNPAFTGITGFLRGEAMGRNPRILRSGGTPREVYADLWRTIVAGDIWRGELVNRRKDGREYREKLTIAPVKRSDGEVVNFIALKEDVSEIHALREALQREHDNLRRILGATHDAIALVDEGGRFEYANPALEEEFGALDGLDCMRYFSRVGAPCPRCDWDMGEDKVVQREWRSGGEGKVYEVTGTPVSSADGRRFILQVFHDITARKRAEEAAEAARQAAEMANRAKTEFLATMSHELRTPLNAIIGFSEIIEGELMGPVGTVQYTDYAHDINVSGRHLLQLINDILDVARIDVGRVDLRETTLDPCSVVRSSLNMVRERAEAADVTLTTDLPDDLPHLWADERRLKQVLVNILGNAVKFTPSGGSVSAAAELVGGVLEITVRDTGIGIRPEELPRIMAPFGQANSGLARPYGGSGLGLPLSKQLMELHGGSLTLDSTPGEGTTVTLRFPRGRLRSVQTA